MKKVRTMAEAYEPAMNMEDPDEADQYLEKLVAENMAESGNSYLKALAIEKSNLAYYAGYYDTSTRERVENLFKCAHPIFGSVVACGIPTPEEAFKAGVKIGEMMKKESMK